MARTHLLKALTRPDRVALIGASGSTGRLTSRPQTFLQKNGFRGEICPVNPTRDTVLGLPAYPSVAAIERPVDHAYILLNAEPAMAAFEECVDAGVKVVSVLADGFAEAGEAGLRRQENLVEQANAAGILLIGPNSTGVVDTRSRFICTSNAAFVSNDIPTGRFAVLSQSGSVIGTILSRSAAVGIGFATYVSVGNEAQSSVAHVGNLLLEDPDIDGFVLFLETLRYPDVFSAFAARAAEAGKPIVAYMIGRSEEGQALSVSHTGALTGRRAALDAFLRDCGVHQADVFEALFEAPLALNAAPDRGGATPKVTVVSTTGGGGAMVVDQLSERGIEIAEISSSSRTTLEAQDIPLGHGKLIDVTLAGANYDTMKSVVSTLMRDPDTEILLVVIGSSAQFNPELAVSPIVDAVKEAGQHATPVLAFPLPEAMESMALLRAGGIPTFRSVESCANSVQFMVDRKPVRRSEPTQISSVVSQAIAAHAGGALNELEASRIFAALGLTGPDQLVLKPGETVPENLPLNFPVVAKVLSRDLPHKTEVGGIRIGLQTHAELVQSIDEMMVSVSNHAPGATVEGVLIQDMLAGLGEAIVGLSRDPLVGPIITVGVGGIYTEIYKDVAIRPAPVSIEQAREMIDEVAGFAVLSGYRGKPKGDLEALAETVAKVSQLASEPRVEEAEINPVLVCETGCVALDGLIRLGG